MPSNDSSNKKKLLYLILFLLLFAFLVFLLLALLFYALPALSLTALVLPMIYAAVAAALFAALSFFLRSSAGLQDAKRDVQVAFSPSVSALACPPAADGLSRPASAASGDAATTNGFTAGQAGCFAHQPLPSDGSSSSLTSSSEGAVRIPASNSLSCNITAFSFKVSAKSCLAWLRESFASSSIFFES